MMWVEFTIQPQGRKPDATVGIAWTRRAARTLLAEWRHVSRLLAGRLRAIPAGWPRVSIRLHVRYRDERQAAARPAGKADHGAVARPAKAKFRAVESA
jgi:hypothetical protein